jgi:hypothetical protein
VEMGRRYEVHYPIDFIFHVALQVMCYIEADVNR